MAMKDWENQRNTEYLLTWTNQRNGKRDELVEVYKNGTEWDMIKMIGNEVTIRKKFKTKSQALAYAKRYMRTH